jgi:hypothetical protein
MASPRADPPLEPPYGVARPSTAKGAVPANAGAARPYARMWWPLRITLAILALFCTFLGTVLALQTLAALADGRQAALGQGIGAAFFALVAIGSVYLAITGKNPLEKVLEYNDRERASTKAWREKEKSRPKRAVPLPPLGQHVKQVVAVLALYAAFEVAPGFLWALLQGEEMEWEFWLSNVPLLAVLGGYVVFVVISRAREWFGPVRRPLNGAILAAIVVLLARHRPEVVGYAAWLMGIPFVVGLFAEELIAFS